MTAFGFLMLRLKASAGDENETLKTAAKNGNE